MEQPEYTQTPMGAARKSETLQARGRSGSALAPWKAKCIQAADINTNCTETTFYKTNKTRTTIQDSLIVVRVYLWLEYLCPSLIQ